MRDGVRRQHSSIAGFSIIEAVLATALMGGVIIALGSVTGQWLPNWNRGFSTLQRAERVTLGLERLFSDLEAAESIPVGRDNVELLFDGAESAVTFVRSAVGPNTGFGLELVRIIQTQGTAGPTLVRMRAPFIPAGLERDQRPELNFTDPVVLLRPPYQVSFAYAGEDRLFRNTWKGRGELPRSIRIALQDRSNGAAAPVGAAVTALHSGIPAVCILAKSIKQCLSRSSSTFSRAAEGARTFDSTISERQVQ